MADIDVVIVNYRSAAHTFNCLRAVHMAAAADGVSVAPVVVNNADDARPLDEAVARAGGGVVIHNADNRGFGAACNQGAARGNASLILFVNPDASVEPGCLRGLRALFDDPQHAAVGIAGPELVDGAGAMVPSCSRLPSAPDLIVRTLGLHVLFPRGVGYPYLPPAAHGRSGPVGQVMGAVMMVRRAAFDSLGGFDPRYFLYYEDVDLCARAARRGMATWYVKEARARHLGGGSSAQESGMALALHIASRLVYCRTHFGRGWQFALGLACAVEACLRLTRGLLSGNLAGVLTAYALLLRRGFTGVPIAARRIAPGAGAA